MDVTPVASADRQVIESYGRASFRVSGIVHECAILVFTDRTIPLTVRAIGEMTAETLAPLFARAGGVEILLLGCGARMLLVPRELRARLKEVGIVVDAMDTGAACRTYNILMAEDRRVAAVLLPSEV
ncbi:MAG TPA: Mth938-like domain-containing protein [Stellaceae bacterium]|nr:Mth938-like domain-containing protein [Stellaceae bacterium]